MKVESDISFLIINFNTSRLVNALIKSIREFAIGLQYNIVIFDNSDSEKMNLNEETNDIIVVDNTTGQFINFNNLVVKMIKTDVGKSNNYASFKHAFTIDYCLNNLDCLNRNVILCDSDILLTKQIDFIDDAFIAVGEVKKTWSISNERLLPMLCYLNNRNAKRK